MQCDLLPTVGHRTKYDEIVFEKNVQCHSHSVSHRTRYDEIAVQKNVQYHSPTVCYRTRCDEVAFQKIVECHPHPVGKSDEIVVEKDVLCMPLTSCGL